MLTAILCIRRRQLSEAERFFAEQEPRPAIGRMIGFVAVLDAACVLCVLLAA